MHHSAVQSSLLLKLGSFRQQHICKEHAGSGMCIGHEQQGRQASCVLIKFFLLSSYWGTFNNYVDKKRGLGVTRDSTGGGHVRKGSWYVKYPCLSTQEGGGQNWVKFGPRSC